MAREDPSDPPAALLERPLLTVREAGWLTAFDHLSSDRQIGMSEGPIPWSSIDRYAQRHGIEGEEFETFVYIIQTLDAEYFTMKSEEAEAARTKPDHRKEDGSG